MNDKAGRCGWVERGCEDEAAEANGLPASGTYETWGLIGWPIEIGEPTPDYGALDETDPFTVSPDVCNMFIIRVEAREGEDLLDVVDRAHNGYMLTCKRRSLTPRHYFFEGFDGRYVALGT